MCVRSNPSAPHSERETAIRIPRDMSQGLVAAVFARPKYRTVSIIAQYRLNWLIIQRASAFVRAT